MISEYLKNRVAEVSSQEEFNNLLDGIKVSNASIEEKEEAIRYLKAQKKEYDTYNQTASQEVMKMIEEGQADISDMGTEY